MNGGLSDEEYQRILAANPDWQPVDEVRSDDEPMSFGASGLRGEPAAAARQPQMLAGGPRFFDKPDSEQYLTGSQKKAMKDKLYAYLADKMQRRGEVTSKAYYDKADKAFAHQERVADANALGGLLLNAGDRAGTVLGRGPASNFGQFADALDGSRQQRIGNTRALRGMEEQSNMNDLQVAQYMTNLERGDEARKDRRQLLYEQMMQRRAREAAADKRVSFQERQQSEVERANRAREDIARSRPAGGNPSYTPFASSEDEVIFINPKDPSDQRREKLPKGFTPKGGKGETTPTESERKAGLQAEVSMEELPFLEEMEKTYRPGFRDAAAGALGGALGNYAYSDEGRRYEAAAERILDPMIRAMSGANAPPAEIAAKRKSYIIQPGDDEKTISDKIARRRVFVDALRKSAGRGAQGEMPPPLDDIKDVPGTGRFKKVPGGWQKVP